MADVIGVNHITFITRDMDRLVAFYEDLFHAKKLVERPLPDREGRHALIDVGGHAVLHPFEIPGSDQPGPGQPMFGRGRLDHFALLVPDAIALETLRERLMARGVSDGVVTDFGAVRVLVFTDPDGMDVELAHWVGSDDPVQIDMSRANDDEIARRLQQT